MKKKSLFSLLFVLTFTFVMVTPSAHAENVQRRRWEGIAIGLGTVILGSALFKSQQQFNQQPFYRHTPDYDDRLSRHYKRKRHHHRGYWET